jgi:hypothetical protein
MSTTTHTHEFYGADDLLEHLDSEYEFSEVLDEIKKHYEVKLYDDSGKTIGDESEDDKSDDKKVNYDDIETLTYKGGKDDPEFVISVEDEDERSGFYSEDRYTIQLPNREAADALAQAISYKGKVVVDNSKPTGSKEFRITYRMEVYIKADSEEEAQTTFENMDSDTLNRDSKFVEMVSCEER